MFEKKLDSLERGKKEFKIQKALYSYGINCPRPIEIKKKDNYYYFVMEKIDGISFRELLEKNNLSLLKKLFILLFTAENVSKMHSYEIKHYDLKPENIMITSSAINNGRIDAKDVYLIDFDISASYGKDGTSTPKYRTFEHQFYGDKAIGKGTDVQALGIILYEVVFGETPNNTYDMFNEKKWSTLPTFKEKKDIDLELYNDLNNLYKMTMKEKKETRITAEQFCKKLKIALNDYRHKKRDDYRK